MYELKKMERYLRVNLLAPRPSLMKKEFTGRGLTKIEKHCPRGPGPPQCRGFTITLKHTILGWTPLDE